MPGGRTDPATPAASSSSTASGAIYSVGDAVEVEWTKTDGGHDTWAATVTQVAKGGLTVVYASDGSTDLIEGNDIPYCVTRTGAGDIGGAPAAKIKSRHCGKQHPSRRDLLGLKVHERVHTGLKPFPCSFCDKRFTVKSHVTRHERLHTAEQPGKKQPAKKQPAKKHACAYCGKWLRSPSDLEVHERVHTGEKPFRCSFCDKRFTVKSNVPVHERLHSGVKPFPCSFCDKRFAQKGSLTSHERLHTGEQPATTHACAYCGKWLRSPSDLEVHERVHTGERPFPCSLCGKRFTEKIHVTAHKRLHTVGGGV